MKKEYSSIDLSPCNQETLHYLINRFCTSFSSSLEKLVVAIEKSGIPSEEKEDICTQAICIPLGVLILGLLENGHAKQEILDMVEDFCDQKNKESVTVENIQE